MTSQSFVRPPLRHLLGIHPERRGAGWVQYRVARPPGSAGQPDGPLATFAITTAVDLAIVDAVSTAIDPGEVSMNGTAELNLTYVAAPRGDVTVRATVLHRGDRIVVVEARVTDGHGDAVAVGRGTYSLRPRGAAA
jgi:acyl-coenzyme A thioesterase PaaI-like protein